MLSKPDVRLFRRFSVFLITAILLVSGILPAGAQAQERHWAPVHPAIFSSMARSNGATSFLVILADQPDPQAYLAQRSLRSATLESKRESLYRYLTAFARERQQPMWAWLDAQGIDYRPFYIINAVEVYGDTETVTALRQRPEVARLAANPEMQMSEPVDVPEAERSAANSRIAADAESPYGIVFTRAPEVWAMGYRGFGVVVASQDTGVDWDHAALRDKYRGWDPFTGSVIHELNWFDAWGSANRSGCDSDPQVPCDDNGHGTHTVGTILGSDTTASPDLFIGMAPGAQWIGCRNMRNGVGTPASYTACFEFFLAPYPQDGDPFVDGVAALAPDIINNSWYCPPSEGCDFDSLLQVVQTVREAGQLVVVSAGNSGPSCESIRYPISAYADVFSVGAHNSGGTIASFSSRGPVTADGSGLMKPEITAPGVSVMSADNGGGYASLSGTSMAAPHVAGAAALLWSAAPALKGQLNETEQILIKSAKPVSASQCMPEGAPLIPNATYGYGQLDVKQAVDMALSPAMITAVLSDTTGAQSISAQVTITDSLTGAVYSLDTAGSDPIRMYPGAYSIRVTWQEQESTVPLNLTTGEDWAQTFDFGPNVILSLNAAWVDETPTLDKSMFLPLIQAP
ncbi:MAG: S8 family serine peptidase [Caldilineaceae bacterium]|nr:S8 family serine peptidase [Caldilineaceae bacterium]